jgi:hypothetical protein
MAPFRQNSLRLSLVLLFAAIACERSPKNLAPPSPPAPTVSVATQDAGADPIATCERGMRKAENLEQTAKACAHLYARARCRAAYENTSDPAGYLGRVVTACATDYCPVLPAPTPAVCAELTRSGADPQQTELSAELLSKGVTEIAKRWAELNRAILLSSHGQTAVQRLARAGRSSPASLKNRAFEIVFALCQGTSVTRLGDSVRVHSSVLGRFETLAKAPSGCAVRAENENLGLGSGYRLVVATEAQRWTDRLVIDLRYDADQDTFSIISVSPFTGDTPSGLVSYRTSSGTLVGVNNGPSRSGLRVEIRNDGLVLFVGSEPVGRGCTPGRTGTTIPKQGRAHDTARLRQCAEKLRKTSGSLAGDRKVALSAGAGTEYTVVIAVLDALRTSSNGKPLFDEVYFTDPSGP